MSRLRFDAVESAGAGPRRPCWLSAIHTVPKPQPARHPRFVFPSTAVPPARSTSWASYSVTQSSPPNPPLRSLEKPCKMSNDHVNPRLSASPEIVVMEHDWASSRTSTRKAIWLATVDLLEDWKFEDLGGYP